MSGIEILLSFSLIACAGGVIGMCFVYQSLENSFRIHLRLLAEMKRDLMELRFRYLGRDYRQGIQSIPKDTEVEE